MNSIADILGDTSPVSVLSNHAEAPQEFISTTALVPAVEQTQTSSTENLQKQLGQAKTMIHSMKDQLDALLRVLQGDEVTAHIVGGSETTVLHTGERIIEGVFNGTKMVGSDGSEYSIPVNYASKSKLVEGDMMKLTITKSGSFIYKQVGPITRKRIVGELVTGENSDQWNVLADGRTYKVLTASVTFYKGKAGDEVVLLVPEDGQSDWAAVENILHR